MVQSVSDSAFSPPPFSPFSSYSVASGVTSDDAPDLGAFTTVFRALNILQPRSQPNNPFHITNVPIETPTSTSVVFSRSDNESEDPQRSTVWPREPVSFLSYSSSDNIPRGRSLPPSDSDSTASDIGRTDVLVDDVTEIDGENPPTLGSFEEAMQFIAAEKAKFVAQRDVGMRGNSSSATTTTTSTSDSIWRHVIQPRRKRRRKKNRSVQETSRVRAGDQDVLTESTVANTATVDDEDGDADDAYDSGSSLDVPSSSPQLHTKIAVPIRKQDGHRTRTVAAPEKPKLQHSKSTPNLLLPVSIPIDARVLHLRNLAHKLRLFFPHDAAALQTILAPESAVSEGFVDTRGPVPRSQDTLIHVFIDHSNILIGFLSYLRRHIHHVSRARTKYLSHAALALILERGRPITRRVLVASSPLYQPVDTAELLGYEVRVYARVPDTGDGVDRQQHQRTISHDQHTSSRIRGHKPGRHSHRHSVGGTGTSTESDAANGNGSNAARVRYREQGVDELLQLKLHQAIADVDDVPPGGTIILATGDGNVGQFNEEGFLGCVRTALKKGWRVELYAWEGGLSRAWMREFGEGPYSTRFEIHMLDRFAADLLEV